ncbi:MAG: peptidoglycan DD-metalloendopeptidase family protein, partial [Candidatus Aegiribacteria sp.]|nr:peptidoglycan DD-metalloendopeptidase family protein [Candidatus Aegiribacteria sp.]
MKYTSILVLLFCMAASSFDWPLDPDDVSHKTDRIYGCYSREWDEVTSETSNFHPGIDLQPPTGTTFPMVHAVAAGDVTDIVDHTAYGLGYTVVVDDDLHPGYYWCYQHLNEPSCSMFEHLEVNEEIGTMYDMSSSSFTHLHLQRIDYPEWDPVTEPRWPGGIADPLNLLEPSNAGYWAFTELPGPSEHPWFYFFEDMSIGDWAAWPSMSHAYADTLAADDLHGTVDIVKGFSVYCTGEYGTNPTAPLVDMPARISWDCLKLNKTSFDIVFSRYPVNFTGEFGSTDDWERYKQFYFRFGWQLFDGAIAACITNCNDNTSWNGVDNIEENCWNTVEASDGSGDSYHPKNMVTPDGIYYIRTTEYAWDSSVQQDIIECTLNNINEIAQEVRLSDAATDQDIWHAEWVASY